MYELKGRYDAPMVRDLLKRSGLTQEEVARQLGVSLATVSRWANGRRTLTGLSLLSLWQVEQWLAGEDR
jgi:putative transcriptional regulator